MPFDTAGQQRRRIPFERATRLLVPAIYAGAAAGFIADVLRADALAYGLIYIPLICTALLSRRRWILWALATACLAMTVIGTFFPFVATDIPVLVGNRVLSALAILVTALLVQYARGIQDQLAAATERAETAERVRTEVLSNLGREMRTPLHSMIAMLALLMTQSRADQRPSLGKMRSGAQQLLLTIDNLVDLTEIDERPLQLRQVDIAGILRAAVRKVDGVAADAGVGIDLDCHLDGQAVFQARADRWMTRRILDNLLFNAIQVTKPPLHVSVSIQQDSRSVFVTIRDAGAAHAHSAASATQETTAGMVASLMTPQVGVGLTLSERLASAMGASLRIDPVPGVGTTAVLSLPLAPPAATG